MEEGTPSGFLMETPGGIRGMRDRGGGEDPGGAEETNDTKECVDQGRATVTSSEGEARLPED